MSDKIMKKGQIWSTTGSDGNLYGWKIEYVGEHFTDPSKMAAMIRGIKIGGLWVIEWDKPLDAPAGMKLVEDVP